MPETRPHDHSRRFIPLIVFLLGVSIASSCRCREQPGGTGSIPAIPPPAQPTAATTPTPVSAAGVLYSWANPLIGGSDLDFADHTWVTTYDAPSSCVPPSEYWYSWGGCHGTGAGTTARDLARAPADFRVARCICQPDLEDYHPTAQNPAHGGVDLYGIDGVCHQLSNRILFATSSGGATPSTVSAAHGYWLSRFLYGTYGANVNEWESRKARCSAPVGGPAPAPTAAAMMAASAIPALDQDLVAMFDERFHRDYSRAAMAQIVNLRHQLFAEKAVLDRRVRSGAMPPRQFANEVNDLLNRYLSRAAEILGPANYQRLFDSPPGRKVGVVDPEIAARSNYRIG